MGDQGPRALIALSDPGTLALPVPGDLYKLGAGLRETCSLYCASPKTSPPTSRVLEDSDLEENHLFESMKGFSVDLLFIS